MHCGNCGAQLKQDARFCGRCGRAQSPAEPSSGNAAVEAPEIQAAAGHRSGIPGAAATDVEVLPRAAPGSPPARRPMRWLVLLLALLIIAAIGAAGAFVAVDRLRATDQAVPGATSAAAEVVVAFDWEEVEQTIEPLTQALQSIKVSLRAGDTDNAARQASALASSFTSARHRLDALDLPRSPVGADAALEEIVTASADYADAIAVGDDARWADAATRGKTAANEAATLLPTVSLPPPDLFVDPPRATTSTAAIEDTAAAAAYVAAVDEMLESSQPTLNRVLTFVSDVQSRRLTDKQARAAAQEILEQRRSLQRRARAVSVPNKFARAHRLFREAVSLSVRDDELLLVWTDEWLSGDVAAAKQTLAQVNAIGARASAKKRAFFDQYGRVRAQLTGKSPASLPEKF